MNICLNCDKEFNSKSGRARFCSDLCRATFHQNARLSANDGGIYVKIYGLVDPRTSQYFYIGKTVGTLEQRLNGHIAEKSEARKDKIIKDLIDNQLRPEIKEIESHFCKTEPEELKALMREEYWIKYYHSQGVDLCNRAGIKSTFKPRFLREHKITSGRTHSCSIRFDPEKIELIKKKEGISSIQKMVDYLMDAYYWGHKLYPKTETGEPATEYQSFERQIKDADEIQALELLKWSLLKNQSLNQLDKRILMDTIAEKIKNIQNQQK